MARQKSKASYRRGLIDSAINNAQNRIQQEQKAAQEAAKAQIPSYAKGMSLDDVNKIIDSYSSQNTIPTLEQNTTPATPSIADELERMKKAKADTTTPRTEGEQKAIDTYYDSLMKASGSAPKQNTPTTNYRAEIDRVNAMKADTTAQRTEGENQAIDNYLKGLEEAQRYLDSQKPKSSKKIGTVEVKADGTKKYTKTMSDTEKKDYEKDLRRQAMIEQGKEIGKQTLEAAKAGKIKSTKALSANEQRDVERAVNAIKTGQAKAVAKWAKDNATPRERALSPNEQRDLERAQEAQIKAKEKQQEAYTQTMKAADTYANNAPENSLAVKTIAKNETPQPTPTAQNLLGAYADTLVQNGKTQEAANFVNDVNKTLQTQYENQLAKGNIDDSKWLVKKADLDRMLQNEEFASDLDKLRQVEFENANQDATVSEEWAKEYGAKNITGGYSEDEYYKLLEDKYNLSKAQLSDIADTLQYYEREKERDTYARDLQMFGAMNPKLGTLASYVGTAGNAIEGAYNTGAALLTGDPRSQSHLFDTTKNELRHGAEYNFKSDFGKGAYQAIAGLGDLGVGAAYGNAPLILAGNTAGEATTGAIERGADVNRAGLTGVGAGVADYFFNKVGLDKAKSLAMDKLTSEGAKQFIKQNLVAGGTEAAENVLQDITETVIDDLINGKNSELQTNYLMKKAQGMTDDEALASTTWDFLKQLGVSAGTGFLMGSGMQAGTTALNNIIPTLTGTPKGEIDAETLATINSDIQDAVAQRQAAIAEMNRLNNDIPRVDEPVLNTVNTPVEVSPENVIYHSGILSRLNKADSAGKMEGTRDTGYYGTGHYFVDGAHKNQIGKGSGYGDKPYSSVDISKYDNLYRADTDAKANKLHDFSQRMMRYVNGHNDRYYTDSEGINADSLKEYMDDLYSEYRDLFGDNALDRNAFETRLTDFRNNYKYDFYDRGDSAFTTFMKEHGYNGVDTRGTNSANVERGIVIYDLDEDSVLQSNVTDEAVKNGLMNTKVRNGNPIFDAETDAKIQKQIDSFNKNQEVYKQYKELYDETALTKAKNDVAKIENAIDNIENNAKPYYESLVNDEEALRKEATRRVREYDEIGLDTTVEEEMELMRETAKEDLEELDGKLADYKAQLEQAKSVYMTEESKSREAYKQAQDIVNQSDKIDEDIKNGNPDVALSKVYTNTLAKNKVINMANRTSKINAAYNVHHMDDVLNEARSRYLKNADSWEKAYADGSTAIQSDADVATAMFLLEDKRARIEALQKNGGDKNEIAKLITERDILARRLRAAGTGLGEAIKAFDYFNGTADGAIINAQRMYDAQAKRWEKKNPNVAKKLEKIADSLSENQERKKTSNQLSKALANLGNDSIDKQGREKRVKTHDEIRAEVEATLEKEFSSVEDIFTQEDVDFITGMIENKIPTWQITDELQHRLEHGMWYELGTDEVRNNGKTNSKLISALNQTVKPELDQTQIEARRPGFTDLREEVRNTLEKEYGSIEGVFDDSDIDYIANLINAGATSKELADMLKTKLATGILDIPQETVEKVNKIFEEAQQYNENSKARVDLETQAFWELANCTKQNASLGEKFEAWRYLSMLGNPKTHIRNIIGNALFGKVTAVSNGMAAIMETLADAGHKPGEHRIQRTKAILTKADSDLIKASKADAENNAYRALSGDKWHDSRGVQNAIQRQKDVFKSDAMNKANRLNNNLLSGEDTWAMTNKYKTSLAGYLKANGFDKSIFDDEVKYKQLLKDTNGRLMTDEERALANNLSKRVTLLNQARDYAVKQAEYAAFHEDNAAADAISEFSRKLNTSDSLAARGLGKVIEGILPFKKTPANILRSGFEYSPMNILQDAVRLAKLGKGTGTAADLFESMGKTLTGDILAVMGAWMFSKGILNIEDDDTKWQGDLEGRQNYSLVIPFGKDKYTFTVDSLAPSFMPIFLGAQAKKMWDADISNPPEGFWSYLGQGLQATSKLLSPIAETSMLSGVNDTLESISSNNKLDALMSLGLTATTGYYSQGIPTTLGQVARIVDPIRRSTYSGAEDPLARSLDKKWQKIENKIPLLSMTNEPYIDSHGNMQYNFTDGNGVIPTLGNVLYQTLSPFYIRKYDPTGGDIATDAIYENGGKNPNVFASNTASKKIGDERLTPEQKTVFDTYMGEANESIRYALANNEDFQRMSPELQAKIFGSLNSFADAVGESHINPDMESTNEMFKAYNGVNEYDDRGFRTGQIQAAAEEVIAANNPYGLEKKVYKQMKEDGEDLTKFLGYKEARESVEMKDSKGLREAWLEGGEQGVKDYAEYQNALEETGLSNTSENKEIYAQSGIEGLQQVAEEKQTAKDSGFVNKDGSANVKQYDKAITVLGDENSVNKYSEFQQKMQSAGYTKQEQYITELEDMSNLDDFQRGQYAMLLAKKTPEDLSGSALKAYNYDGYRGYYYYKLLQQVKDYNGDGKHNKYDRYQLLDEWGFDKSTDEYNFYPSLDY